MLHRWSLDIDKLFDPSLYDGCDNLSMLGWKLVHISKGVSVRTSEVSLQNMSNKICGFTEVAWYDQKTPTNTVYIILDKL